MFRKTLWLGIVGLVIMVQPAVAAPNQAVVAVIGDRIYRGLAQPEPLLQRGIVRLASVDDPALTCDGVFQYLGRTTGQAAVRCSDGAAANVKFRAFGAFSGYGKGEMPQGQISFAFGMKPERALKYLDAPPGKRLILDPSGEVTLAD